MKQPNMGGIEATSNVQTIAAILHDCGKYDLFDKLSSKLHAMNPTQNDPKIISEIWSDQLHGGRFVIGLTLYSWGNNQACAELAIGKSINQMRKLCKWVEETLWLPIEAMASKDDIAEWDRKDGIVKEAV
jgi:hypothetical protein